MGFAELTAAVAALDPPAVVGLSGFGGAGKSTLAARLTGVHVVPADAFLIRTLTNTVTDDWAGVDRGRLTRELLSPFRAGRGGSYGAYDWETDSLAPQAIPVGGVLVVEGVGLIHPDLTWDLSVWLACDPEVALGRALARDRAQGHETEGWATWHATDLAYAARYRPDLHADLVLEVG